MPERCGSCGGHVEDYEVKKRCPRCRTVFHTECYPDVCVRCSLPL